MRYYLSEQTFIAHPGPTAYYSHFISIVYCVFLGFGSFQLSIISYSYYARLDHYWDASNGSKWVVFGYWIGQMGNQLMSLASFIILKKMDCIVISALSVFIGFVGALTHLLILIKLSNQTSLSTGPHPGITIKFDSSKYGSKLKDSLTFFYVCNVGLKAAYLGLNFSFAILLFDLISAYKYSNP